MTIWKYPLNLTGDTWDLALPVGYRILTVQVQHEKPCIWALVDSTELQMVRVKLRCFGTGSEAQVPQQCPHLGTVQLYNGSLVLHFFKLTDPQGVLIS
jgi:hypothetical protein